MKTIALLALLASGCIGQPFTTADPAARVTDGPLLTVLGDAGAPEADGGGALPEASPGAPEASLEASPEEDVGVDAEPIATADAGDGKATEPDEAGTCDLSACRCIPVSQMVCCTSAGACGCLTVFGGSGGCQ